LASRPFPNILPLYRKSIPNCPGKTIVALNVTFPPNGSTPPHTHAGAFVVVNVVSGYTLNKMNNDPMKVLGPGETFAENPGCRHKISDNASATEPATMVATFIVDTEVVEKVGIEGLVVIDEEYKWIVAEAKQKSSSEASGKVSKS
jgi:quercetin dioxygenase-like cupin family protein